MHGIYLGRMALVLLVPAVAAFGLFMFGTGFLSGQFYSDRTAPTETVVRREPALVGQGDSILSRTPHVPRHKEAEESMAQATGVLEQKDGAEAEGGQETVGPDGALLAGQSAELSEIDAQRIRENALAELRARSEAAVQPPAEQGVDYSFQVGAFLVQTNAQELAASLRTLGYDSWVADEKDAEGRLWHFVRVGRFASREQAATSALSFTQRQGIEAVIVRLDGQNQETAGPATAAAPPPGGVSEPPVTGVAPQATLGKPFYVVQAGAFRNPRTARDAAAPLLERGYVPCVATVQDQDFQTWNVVEVATFANKTEAEAFLLQHGQKAGVNLSVRELDPAKITDRQCF
jgi:cell division septation protein DedD